MSLRDDVPPWTELAREEQEVWEAVGKTAKYFLGGTWHGG